MAVNKGANFVLTAQNKGGAAMKQFQGQLQGIKGATAQMAPVGRSWNKGLSENRRAIQQLGFQMTDFSVQIAGGQNAMLAFIQQGGQMLQVFGPAGAILATLLTVFGTLALVIGKSGKSLSELTPIVGVLTDQFQWLADTFRVVTGVLIDGINFIINHLDVLLIAASMVAGYFAGKWVLGALMASNAIRALVFSIMMIGPTVRMATITWTASMSSFTTSIVAATIAGRILGTTMGLMQVATMVLGSALAWVRGILMTFLPYALIIAVAWLIERFIALRQAGLSWGQIMQRLGTFVAAVFQAMGIAAEGMGNAVGAVWDTIAAGAGDMIFWIFDKWNGLMESMSSGFNSMMEAIGSPVRMKVTPPDWYTNGRKGIAEWRSSAEAGFAAAGAAGEEAAAMIGTAWDRLFEGVKDNPVDVRDWFGGGGEKDKGGGAAKKVKEEVDKIKKIFEDLKSTISDSMMTAFKGVVMGTKSLKDAALDMLTAILDKVIEIMMQPIFDSIAGGLAGNIMGLLGFPSFAGGGNTGNGSRSGGLDGKGGFMALMHPQETVIDHTRGQSAGGGSQVIELRITEGSTFGARVEAIANDSAVKITKASLQEYDDRVLPVSMRRVSASPRSR